jgi:hypothetical protein
MISSTPISQLLANLRPRLHESVMGYGEGADLWSFIDLDLAHLQNEAALAINDWDWQRGRFGHSLPLTTRHLSAFGAAHLNNWVATDQADALAPADERLQDFPYLTELFQSLPCDKSSFRLLRRPPNTSYTLHADVDLGPDTHRFQIPLFTNEDAYLMVSREDSLSAFALPDPRFANTKNWAQEGVNRQQMESWFFAFVSANEHVLKIYRLPPGALYYFDTRYYHNVWNFGSSDRITLAFDLRENEWLRTHVFARWRSGTSQSQTTVLTP